MSSAVRLTLATRRSTRRLGLAIARALEPGDLVLLSGDLGAGKTFLARAIARGLGVRGAVTSPTFTLVHEIPTASGASSCTRTSTGFAATRSTPRPGGSGSREHRADGAFVVVEWGEEALDALGRPPRARRVRWRSPGPHAARGDPLRARRRELAAGR